MLRVFAMLQTNSPYELLEYAAKVAGNTLFIADLNGKFPQVDSTMVLLEILSTLTELPKSDIELYLTKTALKHYKDALRRREQADKQHI